MNSVNFTASLMRTANVKKMENGEYRPYTASFVEFDVDNKRDMLALREASQQWGDSFAEIIYDDAANEASKIDKNENIHIYGLTSQQSDFKNINSSEILGLVEYNDNYKGMGKIELLQTNPEDMAVQLKKPKYKKTGTGIIDSLKILYGDKPIIVRSAVDAIKFYEKNGFQKHDNGIYHNELIWNG